jgi:hypothetical protein
MHLEADLPAIISGLPVQPYQGTCYRLVDFAVLTGYDPMMPLYTLHFVYTKVKKRSKYLAVDHEILLHSAVRSSYFDLDDCSLCCYE